MALIPVDNLGQVGIVKDIAPFQLPPNANAAITEIINIR